MGEDCIARYNSIWLFDQRHQDVELAASQLHAAAGTDYLARIGPHLELRDVYRVIPRVDWLRLPSCRGNMLSRFHSLRLAINRARFVNMS